MENANYWCGVAQDNLDRLDTQLRFNKERASLRIRVNLKITFFGSDKFLLSALRKKLENNGYAT